MYENKSTIDNTALENGGSAFANAAYWSSTQLAEIAPWLLEFDIPEGFEYTYNSSSKFRVRAVRAF